MKIYKSTLKKILRSICFLGGLMVMFAFLSHIFKPKDGTQIYDTVAVNAKDAEVKAEADNTIDVLFLGDSECYSSFNPLQIYADYGYTSYVCGTSAQRLCDTYAILESAFTTQNPELVVLETNCLYRDVTSKKESEDHVLDVLSNRLEVFKNHSRWKNLFAKLGGNQRKKPAKNRGFVVRNTVKPYEGGDYMHVSEDVRMPEDEGLLYLNKIQELCEQKGAKLVLVSVPSPKNWNYEKHNGVTAWAAEHRVAYKDLNLEDTVGIDWMTDTKDGGDHLNFDGATKVSHYIGAWMDKEYNLPDRRENPSYDSWKQDCMEVAVKQ